MTKDIMLKVGGAERSFYCDCGCNVFRRVEKRDEVYRCNSCGTEWKGDLALKVPA